MAQTVLQDDVLLAGRRESHTGTHQKVRRFISIELQCRRQSKDSFFLRYVGIAASDFAKQIPVKVRSLIQRLFIHSPFFYTTESP